MNPQLALTWVGGFASRLLAAPPYLVVGAWAPFSWDFIKYPIGARSALGCVGGLYEWMDRVKSEMLACGGFQVAPTMTLRPVNR